LRLGVTLTEQGLVDEDGVAYAETLDWLREIDRVHAEAIKERSNSV
jgi:hypothetical protein